MSKKVRMMSAYQPATDKDDRVQRASVRKVRERWFGTQRTRSTLGGRCGMVGQSVWSTSFPASESIVNIYPSLAREHNTDI